MTVGNGLPFCSSFRSIVLRVKYKKHLSHTTKKNNYTLMLLAIVSGRCLVSVDIDCHNCGCWCHCIMCDNLYV